MVEEVIPFEEVKTRYRLSKITNKYLINDIYGFPDLFNI
jgi:hypothetical protein